MKNKVSFFDKQGEIVYR